MVWKIKIFIVTVKEILEDYKVFREHKKGETLWQNQDLSGAIP